jgi:hypothetical protein
MNLSYPKVYRIKNNHMRIALLFLLMISTASFAQNLPYELERYEARHYKAHVDQADREFSTPKQAISYYLLVYKYQRALEPSNYFPAPDPERERAREYLESAPGNLKELAPVSFLESSGDRTSVEKLNKADLGTPEFLPYQFIAAVLTNQENRKRDILTRMYDEGMITPILETFGSNTILSTSNQDQILTNGLQDLIAVEYALLIGKAEKRVFNVLVSQCKAYSGISLDDFLRSNSSVLVSPAIYPRFLVAYQQELSQKGIGFIYGKEVPNTSLLHKLNSTAEYFSGIGLKPTNPADEGILKSYSGFYEVLQKAEEMGLIKPNKELIKYLKKFSE